MSKKINVLITGANGFVGSKLIEKFLQLKKYNITAVVRKSSDLYFIAPFKKNIKLVYGDIRDKASLIKPFKDQDIVLHVAAFASDWGKYDYFYDVNVQGTKNVCELSLQNRVKHLIYFSSVSIYGFGPRVDAAEETRIIRNKYHYCTTKIKAEDTVRHFVEIFRLPATIIQPGQIYGPNDRTTSFKIIDALIKGQFGFCNSGKQLLSPLYIDNLLQAILLIMQKPKKSIGKTYILTDDIKINWYEYIKQYCAVLKKPLPKLNVPSGIALTVSYLLEFLYKLFGSKTAPLLTPYRIALISCDFHFTPKKIRKDLGYNPDKNYKKNIENTVLSFLDYQNREQ